MSGEVITVLAKVALDWSSQAHRAEVAADCRRCHTPTKERDASDGAIHRSCAERELAAERLGLSVRANTRIADERVRPESRERR